MNKATISFQLKPIESKKPKNDPWYFKCKNIEHNRIVSVEADTFAEAVCAGQSWYCGTFSGPTITNEGIEGAQAIALDIDNDNPAYPLLTPTEALTRLYNIGITPTMVYPSFSHTEEKPKFRIVFFLNAAIGRENIRKWYVLADMLYCFFPEADAASLTISQLWLGTNKQTYCVNVGARLNEQALYNAYIERLWDTTDSTNRSRLWKGIAAKWGVSLTEKGLPFLAFDEDGIAVSPQWLTEDVSAEHMKRDGRGITRPTAAKGKLPERAKGITTVKQEQISNWQERARRISFVFFAGFENGKRIMRREQRQFLLSNLAAIEGGKKYYFEILEKHIDKYEHDMEYYKDEAAKWLSTYTGIMRWTDTIKNNMADAAMEYGSLFEAIKKEEKPYMYEKMGKITVDEANDELKRLLDKILNGRTKGVFGINADTGVGKTQAYIDFIAENKEAIGRTLICVPTHTLKKEIAGRFEKMGIRVCQLEKRPEIGDDCEDKADYWKAIKAGYNSKAQAIWNKYFDKVKKQGFNHPKFQEYLNYNYSVNSVVGSKVVITTHDLSLYTELNGDFDIVIYDEDVCKKMVDIKTTTVNDVKSFAMGFSSQLKFRDMLNKIEQSNGDRRSLQNSKNGYDAYMTIEKSNWNIDLTNAEIKSYSGEIPETDVFSFLHAKSYTIDYNGRIEYSYIRELGFHNSTVIVLSATLSPLIFSKLTIGRNSRFYQIEHIRNKGIIVQDMTRTYSKSHLTDNIDKIVEELNETYPDWKERYLITFKEWVAFFKEQGAKMYFHNNNGETPMTFGNTEGIDALKGEKILIMGKFSFPAHIYLLWASALNIPLIEGGDTQFTQSICHNGYTFRLFTYRQEELRRIQLYLIESELEQATGRGRAVREESADILVLCDIPLHNADEVLYQGNDIRDGIAETPVETLSREIDCSVFGDEPIEGMRPKGKRE